MFENISVSWFVPAVAIIVFTKVYWKGTPFPKKVIKCIFAYLRLQIFGFRVSDAATVTSEICEQIKEHPECTDELRANMEFIANKFQDLKAMKKGAISSVQEKRYQDQFNRLMSLDKNNPDTKGWEKETTKIATQLR